MDKPIVSLHKDTFIRQLWYSGLALMTILGALLLLSACGNRAGSDTYQAGFPDCPSDLAGLLTSPIIDMDSLVVLTPLGNSAPPGHTFPVDHIYFNDGIHDSPPTGLYAPGSGTITQIIEEQGFDNSGNVMRSSVAIDIVLCKGVMITLGSEAVLTPEIREAINQAGPGQCKDSAGKHENENSIHTCSYRFHYSVTAGTKLGDISQGNNPNPEVWAFNYNATRRTDVDWTRYSNEKFTYTFCLFDLYSGDLKSEYYSKFGTYIDPAMAIAAYKKGGKPVPPDLVTGFIPRTGEPICGSINQNVSGTVQGDWFGAEYEKTFSINSKDLALIHSNSDPTIGRFSIGGNFVPSPGIDEFIPLHSGTYNREFSEVTADGNVYCYDGTNSTLIWQHQGTKILVQLMDAHHLKIESQSGTCGPNEKFVNPFDYDR